MREHALQIALMLFGQDPIPDHLVPVAAFAVLESTPALRGVTIDELLVLHRELCIAILSRGTRDFAGVN
jgi:hypothetical protein